MIEMLYHYFTGSLQPASMSTALRVIGAMATALFFIFLFGRWYIKKLYELKIGQPIRDDKNFLLSELHKNKKNTPTMGGGLILSSMLAALILWMDLQSPYTWLLVSTTLIFGFLGGYDDYLKLVHKNTWVKGLSPRKKMLCQFLAAVLVIVYVQMPDVQNFVESTLHLKTPKIVEFTSIGETTVALEEFSARIYLPFITSPVVVFSGIGLILLWLFYIFVIVGSSNAVNLTDGLDGLSSGLLVIVSIVFTIVAYLSSDLMLAKMADLPYIEGSSELAVYMAALVGACLGFLWYNAHPAEVFMGDIGSLSLGGILGVVAVLLKKEFFLGLVGAIFVAEALSVIIQVISFRYFNKRRVFLCAPLHHHFEYKGIPETKVVIRFWIVGVLLALLGLISLAWSIA